MNTNEQMRDALVVVRDALLTIAAHEDDKEFVRTWLALTKDEVNKALALPRRQCDVGTAEVQLARMSAWCRAHQDTGEIIHCRRCPIKSDNYFLCALRWAQMPYDESEAK